MDAERIEKILREHFPQDEPEGARERILTRASRELRPTRSRVAIFIRWAFVVVVAIIILANLSDGARQNRFARVSGGGLELPPAFSDSMVARASRSWLTQYNFSLDQPRQVDNNKVEEPL